ncbi:casein kinase I-like [Anopheles stephensi]|uniref:casein kinase I-like n=1 Tax=Anopheles stephensi TaxID=30069 RepID=UPI001658A9EC|nr:casein kinase I-like [Anopheles stephensi]
MEPYVEGYDLLFEIGSGSFGVVYHAMSSEGGQNVAIKVEYSMQRPQSLSNEYEMYKTLEGGRGIPRAHLFQKHRQYNVMVLDLLGPTLDELFEVCNRRFSLKTVLMLADQMLSRLEYIHAKCIVHRDLKPSNFLMGAGRHCNDLYLIDFGLAKKFRHSPPSSKSACKSGGNVVGTMRYISINAHAGAEQSPRDDLEALGHILVYFLRGSLPWQGITAVSKQQRMERILERKSSTPIKSLCEGLPWEFSNFLSYCRCMDFGEGPPYHKIKHSFQKLFCQLRYEHDYLYDWVFVEQDDSAQEDNPEEEGTA